MFIFSGLLGHRRATFASQLYRNWTSQVTSSSRVVSPIPFQRESATINDLIAIKVLILFADFSPACESPTHHPNSTSKWLAVSPNLLFLHQHPPYLNYRSQSYAHHQPHLQRPRSLVSELLLELPNRSLCLPVKRPLAQAPLHFAPHRLR